MADNGHCSTCQTHNTTSGCGSNVESFKNLFGGQEVEKNETYLKLNSIMPNIKSGETLVTKDTWAQIHNILQFIKDYGEIAENNPTQDKINNVKVNQGNIAFLDDYNKILAALDKGGLSGTQLISKDLIDSLKTNIQKYKINAARCNICNISCQNCQNDCDNDCSSGGNDDGGCYCSSGCSYTCEASYDAYGGCSEHGDY